MNLNAPPIDTNSSRFANAFLSLISALAMFVSGASAIIDTFHDYVKYLL